ncbi:MAG: tripartite tricarboxylate transporter TctB family protein, partial [Chloroflexota bacterium]
MSRRAQENLMALAFLLVFIGFLVVSQGYGPKTRLVPVPLAAVSILLILLQLALQNLRSNLQLSVDTMELFVKRGDGGCDEPK